MAKKKPVRQVKRVNARRVDVEHERSIITDYLDMDGRTVIKRICSLHVETAIANVVKYMLLNKYGSWLAVVYNDYTGEEYRTVRFRPNGTISIV